MDSSARADALIDQRLVEQPVQQQDDCTSFATSVSASRILDTYIRVVYMPQLPGEWRRIGAAP
jgi:hypothetical protein